MNKNIKLIPAKLTQKKVRDLSEKDLAKVFGGTRNPDKANQDGGPLH